MKSYYYLLLFIYLFSCVNSFPLFNKKERYIIQLKKPDSVDILCSQYDSVKPFSHLRQEITKIFSFGKFEGFVGEFSQEVIEKIATNPLVEKITQDFSIQALDEVSLQEDASPHLVRISQENYVDEDQQMNYYYSSRYQGEGVTVYIIDTGVFVDHPQFENRATLGPNFSTDYKNVDYIGHGTHVAGVLGSQQFGVAKKVNIHSIKVLDKHGQGSLSSVISGLEYAVKHKNENGVHGIANLSLGASKSSVLDAAVRAAHDAGLLVVVAAGNNNVDACRTSPAGSPYAITVGAIDDKTDQIAHFSNWGTCVNIFAPGVEVHSLNNQKNPNKVQILSGTSMASPIVAGVAAILLQQGASYDQIDAQLKTMAVWDAIPNRSLRIRYGSPNAIVNNGVTELELIRNNILAN